jgi:hypothetical protein
MPKTMKPCAPLLLATLGALFFSSLTTARTRSATAKPITYRHSSPGWFQHVQYATTDALDLEHCNDNSHDNHESSTFKENDTNEPAGDDPNVSQAGNEEPNDQVVSGEGPTAEETAESMGVGVKSHHSKKSNAVGDPDGEGSDDESDSDSETASWEDQLIMDNTASSSNDNVPVRVELELVQEDNNDNDEVPVAEDGNQDLEEDVSVENGSNEEIESSSSRNGGGVGVRLGRLASRRLRNKNKSAPEGDEIKPSSQAILQAWQPYIFFPPSAAALEYLSAHSRQVESAAKIRLDRRTLYASLLLEWLPHLSSSASTHRKFLDPTISQSLQAALSMACQPQWRKTWARHNAIRLYDSSSADAKACTLAMQETIATALVSCYLKM